MKGLGRAALADDASHAPLLLLRLLFAGEQRHYRESPPPLLHPSLLRQRIPRDATSTCPSTESRSNVSSRSPPPRCHVAPLASFHAVTFFTILLAQQMLATFQHSISVVPLWTLVKLIFIWLGLSLPLVVFGSYRALARPLFEPPVTTSAIPREIPPQPWYLRTLPMVLVGGIVPFGVMFIEFFFFLSSLWMGKGYYLFGFLSIVFLIVVIATAEIAIVIVYSILCSENYHWWWISFAAPASTGVYAFLFSLYYLRNVIQLDSLVMMTELAGYLLIFCVALSVLLGSVGFITSFVFVTKMFGGVKVA